MIAAYQTSSLRPCPVCSNNEAKPRLAATLREVNSHRPVWFSLHLLDFDSPLNSVFGDGVQQRRPQVSTVNLRPVGILVLVELHEDLAVHVGNRERDIVPEESQWKAHMAKNIGCSLIPGLLLERIQQASFFESQQARSLVQVERSATASSPC